LRFLIHSIGSALARKHWNFSRWKLTEGARIVSEWKNNSSEE
jgi:hypothetical protein